MPPLSSPTFVGAPPPRPGARVPPPSVASPGTPGAIPLPAPERSGDGLSAEPFWPPPESDELAAPVDEPPSDELPPPSPEEQFETAFEEVHDDDPYTEPEVIEVAELAPDEPDMFDAVAPDEPAPMEPAPMEPAPMEPAPMEPEPAAAPEPFSFGEVPLEHARETDPFASPRGTAHLADEELEMLFAPEGEGAPPPAPLRKSGDVHYKIRRPSGRVFGPFTEREISDMLGKGELNGNEDVSAGEGDEWLPIAKVAVFEKAVRQMQEAPLVPESTAPSDGTRAAGPLPAPDADRIPRRGRGRQAEPAHADDGSGPGGPAPPRRGRRRGGRDVAPRSVLLEGLSHPERPGGGEACRRGARGAGPGRLRVGREGP